jgi:hypothetical protein
LECTGTGLSSFLAIKKNTNQMIAPYVTPFVIASMYIAYSRNGMLRSDATKLPGNSGTGTATEAAVNIKKNAINIGAALTV